MLPTDYLLNLRRLTRKRDISAYVRMMQRAHEFSHGLNPNNYEKLKDQLTRSNAFLNDDEAILVIQ